MFLNYCAWGVQKSQDFMHSTTRAKKPLHALPLALNQFRWPNSSRVFPPGPSAQSGVLQKCIFLFIFIERKSSLLAPKQLHSTNQQLLSQTPESKWKQQKPLRSKLLSQTEFSDVAAAISAMSRTFLAGISAVLQQELMSQKKKEKKSFLCPSAGQKYESVNVKRERQFKLHEFHESTLGPYPVK